MKIYNTLARKKEEFIPLEAKHYKIYVCGPTVYNFIHVGNARPVCVFDTLRRYLEYQGNKVTYVQNITDIDDKLITKANEEGITVKEVAERYEKEFLKDTDGLNVKRATVHPRATEHIDEILDITKTLVEKGFAYPSDNGDVYFRARRFDEYGKLSHQPIADLESGARVDVNEIKEDPIDFALWKGSKPGEPAWPSPYGPGRPGWHIECSAMARKHLGATIDLHCGGQDLVFPHHENEIAQSECCNGAEFARYWMHNEFINVDSQKMSKSLNNFRTVREVSDEYGYEPIRYLMLSAHYRSLLNFSQEGVEQCKASLERLYTCRDNLEFAIKHAPESGDTMLENRALEAKAAFIKAMDDDLNTADALAAIFEFVKDINVNAKTQSKKTLETALAMFNELTGVLGLLYARGGEEIPAQVLALAQERKEVRAAKNFKRSDEIRDELAALGYAVEDTAQGQKIVKKDLN